MDYVITNWSGIAVQIADHFFISIISLAIACLIGIPAGYMASKNSKTESLFVIPFQILRVVPSLALIVLLIPFMGTGKLPAVTALCILAIPPVLLNTAVGFCEVEEFMVESAAGMGMDDTQILKKVRIPLALPHILTGVRTGLVEVFASATLAAKIGAGGLGEIIFTGLGLNRMDILVVGGLLVAILSLFAGLVFDALQRRVLKYKYL